MLYTPYTPLYTLFPKVSIEWSLRDSFGNRVYRGV